MVCSRKIKMQELWPELLSITNWPLSKPLIKKREFGNFGAGKNKWRDVRLFEVTYTMLRMLPITPTLQKIAADVLQSAPVNEAPLLAWPMACGSSVAGRTKALSFADGVLTIAAADKAWCTQLSSFSDSYLQTLNRICPTQVLRLRFIIETSDQSRS